MSTYIQMDYEKWLETYKPVQNDIVSTSNYDGTMFETYGEELDRVSNTPTEHVWTLIEADGYGVIVNGFAFVNRLGYFICQEPCTDDYATYEVDMWKPFECEETGDHTWVDYLREMDNKTIKVCEVCEMSKEDYDYFNE